MVGLVPPIVIFFFPVVDILSPSPFIGISVVVDLLLPTVVSLFLLVVSRLPVVCC